MAKIKRMKIKETSGVKEVDIGANAQNVDIELSDGSYKNLQDFFNEGVLQKSIFWNIDYAQED